MDRIVSRSLAYGMLTVLLGGGYAGVVLGLGQLLGRQSSVVVAGATLTVALAFQPARRRVQQVVDRRFNRRRYGAARTIEAFAARLRQQIDLDALTGELVIVVDRPCNHVDFAMATAHPRPAVPGAAGGTAARQQPRCRRRAGWEECAPKLVLSRSVVRNGTETQAGDIGAWSTTLGRWRCRW
ncbi:MAG TPA: hypothetical protein VFY84_18440 [Jiangellales bacterium]|nr:hypothetical protein [Jiangellales bacterium]